MLPRRKMTMKIEDLLIAKSIGYGKKWRGAITP